MHQWQKFGENLSIDTGRYSGNMKFWDAFRHAVTLDFDLLTPKSNQFISVPRCTSDKSLAKIRQQILEISWNIKLLHESRTHGQRHGRTTRKHIASDGAYGRRRLKNTIAATFKDFLGRLWGRPGHLLLQVCEITVFIHNSALSLMLLIGFQKGIRFIKTSCFKFKTNPFFQKNGR